MERKKFENVVKKFRKLVDKIDSSNYFIDSQYFSDISFSSTVESKFIEYRPKSILAQTQLRSFVKFAERNKLFYYVSCDSRGIYFYMYDFKPYEEE